jgi:uncharacterized repeat protein (TIGR02543 family)
MRKLVSLLNVFIVTIVISSCSLQRTTKFYELEYFTYAKSGSSCIINELTEKGKEETHLIIPREIDGLEVKGFGFNGGLYKSSWGGIDSKNLKKLYILASGEGYYNNTESFVKSNQTVNIFLLNKSINFMSDYVIIFLPDNNNPYLDSEKKYYLSPSLEYYYNYDNSPNLGVYFIDNYEDTVIDFIPPNPVRWGYTFDGWYKDALCLEVFDFSEVISEKVILYAKWI